MDSINRMAIELVDEALDFAGELGIEGYELDSGATVIDFGVDADGGVEAGMLLAEIQTAGLATVQTRMGEVAGTPRPHVELSTDRPALALLCSQKAGWELTFDGFDGLGSGPARALVGEEEEFHHLGYYDEFDLTVLAVESIDLPTDEVAEHVAETTGLEPSAVFLPTYATGSLVGSVTGAARAAELAVFNLFEAGYDPTNVLSINGSAPLAPVSYDESVAMGRTNDAVAYGGRVHVTVSEDFDDFDRAISTAGADYGVPFERLFEDADWDFGEVDPDVFGPAQVTVDVVDGPTYTLGETDEDVLAESFGL
ncbi:methenyltetrahydromethanopterin cyclohydrolase [Haloferax denitrificans]|uniref:Methenyltetrahydromethanopterin cyclohydrolase n=1 Tax=Haloferax denitrificans ATCC 35960 TaxID=662478 RepID=M0J9L1_9EURY|nr:methenyltetrahydromethanopterin cyclohydrolase [Haloferax denitrificans]EMA04998.1 N(5),N(10)-methenyltetrahydromethanopterin cyclohydrolase [Haloferax denitrificans ATCC 35960]